MTQVVTLQFPEGDLPAPRPSSMKALKYHYLGVPPKEWKVDDKPIAFVIDGEPYFGNTGQGTHSFNAGDLWNDLFDNRQLPNDGTYEWNTYVKDGNRMNIVQRGPHKHIVIEQNEDGRNTHEIVRQSLIEIGAAKPDQISFAPSTSFGELLR